MSLPAVGDKVKFYMNGNEFCTEMRGMITYGQAYFSATVVYGEQGLVNLQVLDTEARPHAILGVPFENVGESARPAGEYYCTA